MPNKIEQQKVFMWIISFSTHYPPWDPSDPYLIPKNLFWWQEGNAWRDFAPIMHRDLITVQADPDHDDIKEHFFCTYSILWLQQVHLKSNQADVILRWEMEVDLEWRESVWKT